MPLGGFQSKQQQKTKFDDVMMWRGVMVVGVFIPPLQINIDQNNTNKFVTSLVIPGTPAFYEEKH